MLMSTVLTCVLRREEFILNVNFPFSLVRQGMEYSPGGPACSGLPFIFEVVQELREGLGKVSKYALPQACRQD